MEFEKFVENVKETIKDYLPMEYIKTHKRLFKTVIEKSSTLRTEDIYERMFRHVFTPILERVSLPKEEHKYIMSFYIRGLMGIVAEWLKNDCSDDVGRILRTFKIKKNVEVTDNGKIII